MKTLPDNANPNPVELRTEQNRLFIELTKLKARGLHEQMFRRFQLGNIRVVVNGSDQQQPGVSPNCIGATKGAGFSKDDARPIVVIEEIQTLGNNGQRSLNYAILTRHQAVTPAEGHSEQVGQSSQSAGSLDLKQIEKDIALVERGKIPLRLTESDPKISATHLVSLVPDNDANEQIARNTRGRSKSR